MAQTSPTEVAPGALDPAQGRSEPALLDTVLGLWERPVARWVILFLVALAILSQMNFTGIDPTKRIRLDELGWRGAMAIDLASDLGPEFDPEDRNDRPQSLLTAIAVVNWAAAIVVAAAITLNFFLISLVPAGIERLRRKVEHTVHTSTDSLPFYVQAGIMWAELLGLFLYFFYSFELDFEFIEERTPHLLGLELRDGFLQGAALTLFICIVSIVASTILALVAALARLSSNGAAFGIATFYTSFFRGTPLLLQLILIYWGLTQIDVILSALMAGIIAVSLCYGAYMAEIFRAGILAIPKGQSEAAASLGLTKGRTMQLIVLPQAMRLIIPPTGNQFIAMLKDSSLVSVLGVWELMQLAQTHGRSEYKFIEMLIVAALIYWGLSFVFEMIQARIERKFGKGVRVD